jgi:uncharacterized protein (TIGR02271 family)
MIGTEHLQTIVGSNAVDNDGDKLGKIGNVYLDDRTGEPAWATVNTGLFGTKESFVPLATARIEGDQLVVPFDKAKVKDAPKVADDGHIGDDEQEELYRYYGLSSAGANGHQGTSDSAGYAGTADAGTYGDGTSGIGTSVDSTSGDGTSGVGTSGVGTSGVGSESGVAAGSEAGAVGHDTSGPTTDNAMTRSEEQLHVGTETRESGRARLRKYVVTEQETVTVPVQREEVRVEREPITDANRGAALDGPAISEEEHEVVLHEERPVVEKEAVPVERVRLGTETVTDQQQVTEEVRKEQIDTDGDGIADRR